ncbi:HypC/HybG/HupF family hydrogenase formation chaperone [Acidihalobacter prosperus]
MCLGIPMQIIEINDYNARCQARGIERDVNLFMLQGENVKIGDHVMVHVGYALQIITMIEAESTWELLDRMLNNEPAP